VNKRTFCSENVVTTSYVNIGHIIQHVLPQCTVTLDSSEVSGGDSVRQSKYVPLK
jgi:hypothetical protein